jgi:pimeloyl-ACP methyl ester carboxylesterase
MIVEVPSWYGPLDHPALPLVVSPHTRASNPFMTAAHWRGLPGRCRIIVLDAGLSGRVTQTRSWGWPPEIAEITRLPGIARRLVPYPRYDPNRVYLAGESMGGQEVLLALERRPDLFAAAVASDPATNMLRRWYQFPHSVASRGQQAALTREVGVARPQSGGSMSAGARSFSRVRSPSRACRSSSGGTRRIRSSSTPPQPRPVPSSARCAS